MRGIFGGMRFLLVRLSSMGDIVLTTPLIRALAEKFPEAELHFLTKSPYVSLLIHHPYLRAVHVWGRHRPLLRVRWSGVIDLQKSLRTFPLRWQMRYERFTTFPKENRKKWVMVRRRIVFPLRHVVLRYAEALSPWGIAPTQMGRLEVYIPLEIQERVERLLSRSLPREPWLAVGLGGTYGTKRWLLPYFQRLLSRLAMPVILLGGEAEASDAYTLAGALRIPAVVGAGHFSLLETAAAIRVAAVLLSHDTGTAHLGAAVGTPTAVLWGNTVPEFGMTPWQVLHTDIEVRHLRCRPCSKLGFDSCPKGHHDCMRALTPDYVESRLRDFLHIIGLL